MYVCYMSIKRDWYVVLVVVLWRPALSASSSSSSSSASVTAVRWEPVYKCTCLIFGVSIGLDPGWKCTKGIFDRSKFKVTRYISPTISGWLLSLSIASCAYNQCHFSKALANESVECISYSCSKLETVESSSLGRLLCTACKRPLCFSTQLTQWLHKISVWSATTYSLALLMLSFHWSDLRRIVMSSLRLFACLSVCLSVCLSLCPLAWLENCAVELHQIFVPFTCGRGSVLLWRRFDTLCISVFVDDVIFSHTGPQWAEIRYLGTNDRLSPSWPILV